MWLGAAPTRWKLVKFTPEAQFASNVIRNHINNNEIRETLDAHTHTHTCVEIYLLRVQLIICFCYNCVLYAFPHARIYITIGPGANRRKSSALIAGLRAIAKIVKMLNAQDKALHI